MAPFKTALTDEFTNRINAFEAPTVGDVLKVLQKCCAATKIGDRDDIYQFSIMGDVGEVNGQHFFVLEICFNVTRLPTGEPCDDNDSLVCQFRLDESHGLESGSIEFGNAYSLDQVFELVSAWPNFREVKDQVLPFKWYPPCS